MQRKLSGYFLLSFLSFCFFTAVFLATANVQVSADQTAPQQQTTSQSTQPIPTPTIYMGPLATSSPQTVTQSNESSLPSPTPTIYVAQEQVLAATTQAPTPEPTKKEIIVTPVQPTDTPVPTDTLVPTATPLPTQTPQPSSTDLETLFGQYSSTYNVSEDELKKIAGCESGFNTNSDSGYYTGMFQFSPNTWASVRGAMGLDTNPDLRKNPGEAIKTAAYMLGRGEENAWPNCH